LAQHSISIKENNHLDPCPELLVVRERVRQMEARQAAIEAKLDKLDSSIEGLYRLLMGATASALVAAAAAIVGLLAK